MKEFFIIGIDFSKKPNEIGEFVALLNDRNIILHELVKGTLYDFYNNCTKPVYRLLCFGDICNLEDLYPDGYSFTNIQTEMISDNKIITLKCLY